MENIYQQLTQINASKFTIIAAFILSWTLLLWINFAAELSLAMHYIAMPTLFIITGGWAAYQLEHNCKG